MNEVSNINYETALNYVCVCWGGGGVVAQHYVTVSYYLKKLYEKF